jgi:hypothetical protein
LEREYNEEVTRTNSNSSCEYSDCSLESQEYESQLPEGYQDLSDEDLTSLVSQLMFEFDSTRATLKDLAQHVKKITVASTSPTSV